MREILFRGKRTDNGEWVEGDLIQCDLHDAAEHTCIMPQTLTAGVYRVLPETVGQYTGLTDKNGKRIFEGDICRFKRLWGAYFGEIIFNFSTATFAMHFIFTNGAFDKKIEHKMLLSVFDDIEVIGNIHENPELLGEEDT